METTTTKQLLLMLVLAAAPLLAQGQNHQYVIEDTGCTTEQAMEQVYNSPLMTLLQDEEGELYVQSPAYLYELMRSQP